MWIFPLTWNDSRDGGRPRWFKPLAQTGRPTAATVLSPAFGLRPLAGVRVGSYDPTSLAGVTVPSLGYPVVFAPEGPSVAAALSYPDLVLFNCRPQSGELRKHSPVPIIPPEGGFTSNVSLFEGSWLSRQYRSAGQRDGGRDRKSLQPGTSWGLGIIASKSRR